MKLSLAAVLAAVMAVAVEQPAFARPSPTTCPEGDLRAEDQRSALSLAAGCEAPVEISSARTPTERQFAQPDGTVTLESYVRPQWVKDRHGRWVDADPDLVRTAEGGITTRATTIDLRISPGGSVPLVTAKGEESGSLQLGWPERLPEPVLAGPTATYPDVLPGVDLQVTAAVDGFSYSLVVHTASADVVRQLADLELTVVEDGLELSTSAGGTAVARDARGEPVLTMPAVSVWDSSRPTEWSNLDVPGLDSGDGSSRWVPPQVSDVPDAEPGRMTMAAVDLEADTLRVAPDLTLLTDPDVVFPVTIQTAFQSARMAWATVGNGRYADDTWWNDAAWPRLDGLRMGFLG